MEVQYLSKTAPIPFTFSPHNLQNSLTHNLQNSLFLILVHHVIQWRERKKNRTATHRIGILISIAKRHDFQLRIHLFCGSFISFSVFICYFWRHCNQFRNSVHLQKLFEILNFSHMLKFPLYHRSDVTFSMFSNHLVFLLGR